MNARLVRTWALFCDLTVNSLPVLIFGLRRALVKSVTENPSSLAIFWAPVLSGRMAWSEVRSCLNFRLPKWSTAETTRKIAGGGGRVEKEERSEGGWRGEEKSEEEEEKRSGGRRKVKKRKRTVRRRKRREVGGGER